MIKNIIIATIFFVSANVFSQKQENRKMPENFYGCWTSSYEENDQKKPELLIYRPCKYKEFKASMYRHTMVFEKSGKCTYLAFSPTDAHYEAVGTWVYAKKKDWITIVSDKNEVVFKFKIKKIGKDLMKIITPGR
jgi:hypothetical protein